MLDRLVMLAGGLDHPESVAWDPQGSLVAGGEAGQIYRVGLDGNVVEVANAGGFMYGVAVAGDGEVFACDYGNARVSRFGSAGEPATWSVGTPDRPLQVPNFLAFDEEGALYVTDSGAWGADNGAIFKVTPEGRTDLWSTDVPAFPNGCCLSIEGDALLVVESRARRVVAVAIGDDGTAGAVRIMADLTGSQPDGIASADDGSLLVGCYRPDRIWLVRPDGEVGVLAEDPDGVTLNQPANVAFYGDRLDQIVVSSLGGWNLMRADIGLRGAALRYPKL